MAADRVTQEVMTHGCRNKAQRPSNMPGVHPSCVGLPALEPLRPLILRALRDGKCVHLRRRWPNLQLFGRQVRGWRGSTHRLVLLPSIYHKHEASYRSQGKASKQLSLSIDDLLCAFVSFDDASSRGALHLPFLCFFLPGIPSPQHLPFHECHFREYAVVGVSYLYSDPHAHSARRKDRSSPGCS